MRKFYQLLVAALAVVVFCCSTTQPIQAQELSDEEVGLAIEKIKEYLFESQHASGAWFGSYQPSPTGGQPHHQWGETAMAVLALIVSGESPQRPEIQKALELLMEVEIQGVYPLSMRTHVWSYLPDQFKTYLDQDGSTMLESSYQGARFDYYVYGSDRFRPGNTRIDNSTTQYGILALWQVAKRGGRIPDAFWQAAVRNFLEMQQNDGGWAYSEARNTTQSMTCAGLAVLLVAQQELYRGLDKPNPAIQAAINGGLGFLDRNWSVQEMNAHGGASYTYYGYERVGLASGRKYFAGQDWFATIARSIVEKNARYGNSVHAAAFELMFLSRGRVPVWINKLQIDDAQWNNRPNDVYFLNRYISSYIETEVNWQIVDIKTDPQEWLNAPLMWLSSPRAIEFTDEQVAKIKRYLDMGGTLIVNPENRSSAFRDSIITLGQRMYPHMAFSDMEATHPIARLVSGDPRARRGPQIKVLSNGARDLIILPQQDWGMRFQRDERPDPSKDDHWRYITNIYAVVTDRGKLTPRLSSPLVVREQRGAAGTIKIVTATIGDQPLPETDVYASMKNVMFNATGYELLVEVMPLANIGQADATLVHLIGVDGVELSMAEKDALKAYVESGGTVLIETLGGRGDFAATVSRQFTDVVSGQDQLLRSRTGSIITGRDLADGRVRNRRVIFRPLTIELANPGTAMMLRGFLQDERYPVLVSNEDISLGMLGVRQYGINGYSVDSSRNIMINVLLEAKKAHPGSVEPTTPVPAESPENEPAQTAPDGG